MTRWLTGCSVSILGALAASPASALEAFKTYDNFNAPLIDQAKWPGYVERVRQIEGKKLHLLARDYAGTATNTDSVGTVTNQNLPNPSAVTALRATITVNDIQAVGCATNAIPTQPRARIYGDFFNVGVATPGSQLNDVTAQVRLIRSSNTTDAPGVLRVEALIFLCNDAACITTTTLGSVDLGTATLRQAVTAQLQWDKPNKRFLFSRDGGAATAVTYTVSDSNASGSPIANVSLRNVVPNCTSAPRPTSFIDASFDNLSVNQSAAP